MGEFKYKAFISYSHKDTGWARWLHRRLESYVFPKNTQGKPTAIGPVPKNLKPIFRDREELAAADNLGDKIESALSQSENLIIICSPAAATSHWVNQEILFFKKRNRGAKIFSVIVGGEPYAANILGRESEECLPQALRFEVDGEGNLTDRPAEPLAADLRPEGDGKRLAVLKLISGMAGLGLDDLVQRDLQRARRRVTAITASAISAVLVMGSLTWFAVDAKQEADARRNDAEGQIEFMLTDLKEELKGVGRLDALQIVGDRANAYYDKYPISEHDDEALGRRARVLHFLGETKNSLGHSEEANKYFHQAYEVTQTLLKRDPINADRIFEHAQSAFWVGYPLWESGNYKAARPYFDEYIVQAEALQEAEPQSLRGKQELAYAYGNFGILLFKQGYTIEAHKIYTKSLDFYKSIALDYPNNLQYQLDLANAYGWLADINSKKSAINDAINYRKIQRALYIDLIAADPRNLNLEYEYLGSAIAHVSLLRSASKFEEAMLNAQEGYKRSYILYNFDRSNQTWAENLIYFLYEKLIISIELSEVKVAIQSRVELDVLRKRHPYMQLREPKKLEKLENLARQKFEEMTLEEK